MTVSHRRMRSPRRALSAALLGTALLGVAPAAHATDITNPAEHPDPITVTIDGQTYHDGADTLPGYDDYACTPIPNVQYDFSDDQIQYYGGQGELIKTAHWTEWSRISSYETWVKQQQGASPSGTPTTSSANATPAATSTTTTSTATPSPAAAAPAATSPASTSPAGKTTSAAPKTKGSTTTKTQKPAAKPQRSATTTKGSATSTETASTTSSSSQDSTTSRRPSAGSSPAGKRGAAAASPRKRSPATKRPRAASPTAGGASAGGTSAAPTERASAAGTASQAQAGEAPASTARAAGTPKFELVSDKGVAGGVADTRPLGIGILVAVFGVACLAFLFGSARRRRNLGGVAS